MSGINLPPSMANHAWWNNPAPTEEAATRTTGGAAQASAHQDQGHVSSAAQEPASHFPPSRPGQHMGLSSTQTYLKAAQGAQGNSQAESINRQSQHIGMRNSIYKLSERIACRTKLSTTGYQSAMSRLNNASRPDDKSEMTLARAKEYIDFAKKSYPEATLKSLAELQKNTIYKTPDGKLLTGIEMSQEELTHCLKKCREHEFSNCDIQALETGLHLWHSLNIKNFTIFSNKKMSHNYVVLDKSIEFPKGAIVDPWTGRFLQEMDLKHKLIFSHWESNLKINKNMHDWIATCGKDYVLDEF